MRRRRRARAASIRRTSCSTWRSRPTSRRASACRSSNYDEDEVAELLANPVTMLGLSDAGAHASQLCDACFSTHLLGHWVREKSTLTLEQAVRMLTSRVGRRDGHHRPRPARQPGLAADVTVFDPDTVGCSSSARVRDLPGGTERLVADAFGIRRGRRERTSSCARAAATPSKPDGRCRVGCCAGGRASWIPRAERSRDRRRVARQLLDVLRDAASCSSSKASVRVADDAAVVEGYRCLDRRLLGRARHATSRPTPRDPSS